MGWSRKDLLSMQELDAAEITLLIDTAASLQEIASREIKKVPALRGKTIVNLFYEASTRTRTSFEIAGKWLSADVINFSASGSSTSKGESFIDTAKNIAAMSPDVVVGRRRGSARARAAVLDRERGRRGARAPDPGAARPLDDPREEGPLRRIARGDRRRHRPQPRRALRHPRHAQARHDGHGGRAADADPAVRAGTRREGELPARGRDRGRRRDHGTPPAAGADDRRPDPLAPRVLALLGPHARQAGQARAARRPDHASRPRESRHRAGARGRRRPVLGHPRPGRPGRGGADGRSVAAGRPQGCGGRMSLVIRGGRVIDPANNVDAVLDVLIEHGKITRLGHGLETGAGVEVVDASGKIVCPGFIDMHVHLREPGQEYKETVATGTRAAAAGGFTAVCCMANTNPVNDNGAVTDYILAKAKVEGLVRVYPIGAVTKNLKGQELAELAELAESGCVAFSDDGKCVMNAALYRRAMEYTLPFGAPIISHAEDASLSAGGSINEGVVSTELGLPGQPAAAEDVMVARDILLAELTGAHVHIAHASTAGTVRLLRDAKARGIRVTAEVTPHHLVLTEDAVRSWDANTKMAPPLRTKRDVEALIEGLADGTIDCIATDHAPHALSEKEGEFDHAAFGIVGLETAVAVVLDRLVRPGHLPLPTLIARWSRDPARLLNLPGGTLSVGAPGDVTILDLDAETTVNPSRFHSRSRNTPFGGWALRGGPWMTIVGGAITKAAAR